VSSVVALTRAGGVMISAAAVESVGVRIAVVEGVGLGIDGVANAAAVGIGLGVDGAGIICDGPMGLALLRGRYWRCWWSWWSCCSCGCCRNRWCQH
jgi:hypothetical protein